MSLEAQYAGLQKQFEDKAHQARTCQNMIKHEEDAIRALDGHDYDTATIQFTSPDGTQATYTFKKSEREPDFNLLFKFNRDMRFVNRQKYQGGLAALTNELQQWMTAGNKPPEPPDDRNGPDDDETDPVDPPPNGNGQAKRAEVPETIKKRTEAEPPKEVVGAEEKGGK